MRRVISLVTLAGALVAMMALPGAAVAQSSVLDDFNLDSPPVTVLQTELSGEEEVPPGDPDGSGSATIILIRPNTICYVLTAENIAPATAAHIHKAPPGEPGPVVVPLDNPPTYGASGGCTVVDDPEVVSDIQENPGNYYVNVHNAEYPEGAIRGQLSE